MPERHGVTYPEARQILVDIPNQISADINCMLVPLKRWAAKCCWLSDLGNSNCARRMVQQIE